MAFSPPFSLAEHIHVQVCRVAYPEMSYGDIARRLNLIFLETTTAGAGPGMASTRTSGEGAGLHWSDRYMCPRRSP
jgi:hypothetical protein